MVFAIKFWRFQVAKKKSKGRRQLDDSLERAMLKDKTVAVANAFIWQGMSEQTKEPQVSRPSRDVFLVALPLLKAYIGHQRILRLFQDRSATSHPQVNWLI